MCDTSTKQNERTGGDCVRTVEVDLSDSSPSKKSFSQQPFMTNFKIKRPVIPFYEPNFFSEVGNMNMANKNL